MTSRIYTQFKHIDIYRKKTFFTFNFFYSYKTAAYTNRRGLDFGPKTPHSEKNGMRGLANLATTVQFAYEVDLVV